MDTNAPKTPATLPFAAWQSRSPAEAARAVQTRLATLPPPLRSAALAWLRPERDLGAALGAAPADAPLRGLPYLLKDLFDLAGVPTRAGSIFLDRARSAPGRDSTIVTRLAGLGAACAGKTHLVEFAAGLFGDNAHYGDCPHPHFPDRLAGGSSSGSAALVAAGVAPFSLGTDTGGSVRVPASFCGLHGFRLSPHDEFICDALPLSPTLDTAGWFTANAPDMLTTIGTLVGLGQPGAEPRGCHLPAAALGIAFDPDTAAACDREAARFSPPADPATSRALLAAWENSIEAYSVTALSEAHAVHRDWLAPYREHYEPSIWQRFSDGGHYPPELLARAAARITTVRESFRQFFTQYDFLAFPAVPFPALRKADCTPENRNRLLTLGTPGSLAGLPILTLPVSLPSGLTAGVQIILSDARSPVVSWLLKTQ